MKSPLVTRATEIAIKIAKRDGEVTSVAVWKALLRQAKNDEVLGQELAEKDKRWLGAVFLGRGWERIGWKALGSHGRPVSVWKRQL